jgi:hypothetical protein
LIGATTVSLIGNIALAVLPYIPLVIVQIGALGYQTPVSTPPSAPTDETLAQSC